jgi:cobalt/nickel transport system permease protein
VHHRTVEQLAAGVSPLHRLDPRAKLLCVLAYIVGVAVAPAVPALAPGPALLVLAGILLARLPLGFVLSRTLLVLPFAGFVAVFLPFTRGETLLGTFPLLGLAVYTEGLMLAISVVIKAALAILAVQFLVLTTRYNHLLLALRSLRVPQVVVAILAFLFRYLDLLADESLRIRRARRSRSPGRTVRWRGRSTGGLVGRLFLRALDRADRVHGAMLSRGFDGEVRLLVRLKPPGRAEACFVAVFLTGASFLVAFGCWMGGGG